MSWNLTVRPKYVTVYERLFQDTTTKQITLDWSDIFTLDVDKAWLSEKLQHLDRDECLGKYKAVLNLLFRRSLDFFSKSGYDDSRKRNSLETLVVFVMFMLSKQLSGWEVMDVFAGGVGESDGLFSDFTRTIDEILGDEEAPTEIRHRTLQLAVTFACGVNQLSPGAYLLRRDLFPSLVSFIVSPKTRMYSFEATLLLSVLSNFHKSDAGKTNPYLNQLRETSDTKFINGVIQIMAYTIQKAASAYQEISDDSPPTLATTLGSFVSSLRPDHALSSTPINPPRELFKNQPIEATVVLLALYDFLHLNKTFKQTFASSMMSSVEDAEPLSNTLRLPYAALTLTSYLTTHASSTSSPRVLAYAHLALSILLVCVEDRYIMNALHQPPPKESVQVRICRQRQPYLPFSPSSRPPMCALLDCCVLWLRHNLHKRLDVLSYLTCIKVLRRVIWFVAVEQIRLEYHWEELWRSTLSLLNFVTNHIGSLKSSPRIDELVQEVICFLDFSIHFAERFLPTPLSLHRLVYELVRSASLFVTQDDLFKSLKRSTSRRQSVPSPASAELARLRKITEYYEKKLLESKVETAEAVMKLITKEVDQDGVFGLEEQVLEDLPRYSDNVADYTFVRWACLDGLALMRD